MPSTANPTPHPRARTGRGRPLTTHGHADQVALHVVEVRGRTLRAIEALRDIAVELTELDHATRELRAALPEAA